MSKNLLIGGVIVVLLLAVGGYFVLGRQVSAPENAMQEQTSVAEKKSFRDLLGLGINQTCTFSDSESGSDGTVFMGNNNVRGDFTSNVNGTKTGSHMILTDTDMYVWMDTSNQGFKMSRDAIEDVQDSMPEGGPNPVDINKQVGYKCSSWSVDTAKFATPSNVTFVDQTKMMQDASKMMEKAGVTMGAAMEGNQAACSACNNLPAQAQAQCKTSLKCN